MSFSYNKSLVPVARALRKNMTPEERHLWYDFLKKLPLTVNRQKNIGNYIVDFFIPQKGIVIEVDGRQHTAPEHAEADRRRDSELYALGITVLRYPNRAVSDNFRTVCEDILKHIGLSAENLK